MGSAERRIQIIKALCRRRHDTIMNLAFEFGVSDRTIRRDIQALSLTEPIYTQTGKYGGGVYVVDGYNIDKLYFSERETEVLHKLYEIEESRILCVFSIDELSVLKNIIVNYSKPIRSDKNFKNHLKIFKPLGGLLDSKSVIVNKGKKNGEFFH